MLTTYLFDITLINMCSRRVDYDISDHECRSLKGIDKWPSSETTAYEVNTIKSLWRLRHYYVINYYVIL